MQNLAKIIYLLLCICLCHTAYAEEVEDDDGAPPEKPIFQVYDDITLSSAMDFFNSKPRVYVKAVYPQLESESENENITNFNSRITELIQEQVETFNQQAQSSPDTSTAKRFYIDYDTSVVSTRSDHIISVRFTLQGNLPGLEQPFRKHIVLNYNLDTGEEVQLDDLFAEDTNYLEVISAYAENSLTRRFPTKSLMRGGIVPKPENFALWNFKPNGLLFTFDQYQVAPSAFGTQTVLVPYSALKA